MWKQGLSVRYWNHPSTDATEKTGARAAEATRFNAKPDVYQIEVVALAGRGGLETIKHNLCIDGPLPDGNEIALLEGHDRPEPSA